MNETAKLLVPALRWDRAHGFRYLDGLIDDALELGVGGFLVDGGPREEVATLVARLHAESAHPLLVAASVERGAGGSFQGLTQLPSFGAIATVAVVHQEGSDLPALDVEVVRRAARLAVRELKSLGVNWALGPVCDVDVAHGNPIIGARGASGDPAVVGAIVAEWIDACQADAVLACAMHFPGLGRTAVMGHEGSGGPTPAPTGRPMLSLKDGVAFLRSSDFRPFAAAIDAGVGSVMVAPVSVPAFNASEGAMTSAAMIENVLRAELAFDGIAVTVPFDREPTVAASHEAAAAVSAVAAGCDAVLAPGDLSGVADALARAASRSVLGAGRVREARERIERRAGWAQPSPVREPSMDDILWSRQLADRAVRYARGGRPRVGATIEVVAAGLPSTVGVRSGMLTTWTPEAAPEPVDTGPFVATLRAMHIDVTESTAPDPRERAPLVIVHAPSARVGEAVTREHIRAVCAMANAAGDTGRDVVVVACCHPREGAALVGGLTGNVAVLSVWDETQPMLEAAARALVSTAR